MLRCRNSISQHDFALRQRFNQLVRLRSSRSFQSVISTPLASTNSFAQPGCALTLRFIRSIRLRSDGATQSTFTTAFIGLDSLAQFDFARPPRFIQLGRLRSCCLIRSSLRAALPLFARSVAPASLPALDSITECDCAPIRRFNRYSRLRPAAPAAICRRQSTDDEEAGCNADGRQGTSRRHTEPAAQRRNSPRTSRCEDG